MLGRLRMSVGEALEEYKDFGNAVFGSPRWCHEKSLLWLPRSKYATRKLRGALLKVIGNSLRREDPGVRQWRAETERFLSPDYRCGTMVVAFSRDRDEGLDTHYLFRTYDHHTPPGHKIQPMNPGSACSEPIWKVARATSAAPTYFGAIKFSGKKFLDGGLGANNPGKIALKEVKYLHGRGPAWLLSIGTGVPPRKPQHPRAVNASEPRNLESKHRKQCIKKWRELVRIGKEFMVDAEGIADDLLFFSQGEGTQVVRFNAEDVGAIALDEWQPSNGGQTTLEKIREHTKNYLRDRQDKLTNLARELVDTRTARAKTERWEKFATTVVYRCPVSGCAKLPKRFEDRAALLQHIQKEHPECQKYSEERMDATLDGGRIPAATKLKQSRP
ncbi:MAG: hypothetical protein M1839_005024 [Geoglossum umbratile]|nr:MAG: hypothetical protein M1839_005024 [Geoglossum umbratile]